MHKRTRTLSIDDRNAVDVCLDHAASAGKTQITRIASPVEQRRLEAVGKVLSLLSELTPVDPPANLVARTMGRIERHLAQKLGDHLSDSVSDMTIH